MGIPRFLVYIYIFVPLKEVSRGSIVALILETNDTIYGVLSVPHPSTSRLSVSALQIFMK